LQLDAIDFAGSKQETVTSFDSTKGKKYLCFAAATTERMQPCFGGKVSINERKDSSSASVLHAIFVKRSAFYYEPRCRNRLSVNRLVEAQNPEPEMGSGMS
jgi:hypothetical protein